MAVANEKNNKKNLYKLDTECVLQPVMNDVCRSLKIYDLCHVAQVCKSWYQEAQREMDKRYLEHKIVDGLFSKEISDGSSNMSKVLRIKPSVSILFPGSIRDVDDIRSQFELELETSKKYFNKLPSTLIVIGVFEAMLNKTLIHSMLTPENQIKNSSRDISSGTLGLFFPKNKKINVQVSCISEYDFYEFSHEKTHDIISNLGSGPSNNSKSTIIIFVANPDRVFDQGDHFLTSMLKVVNSKYAQKPYSLWGLVTSYKIFACNNEKVFDTGKNEAKIVALNLTGPNLESWSTVIKINITRTLMENLLQDFRKKIQFKKCNLGLIAAPILTHEADGVVCYKNNDELVGAIKNIFPEITFVGTYCEDEDFYFGRNSENDPKEPVISSGIISLMIITYD